MKVTDRKIFVLVLALVLILSLVVVGCGKSTETGDNTSTETNTAVPDVFKLGGLLNVTGYLAVLGGAEKQGAEMAVEDINAAGGLDINGKKVKVELVGYDIALDNVKSVDFARRLIDVDKVNTIVGGISGVLDGILKITDASKVIMFDAIASSTYFSVGSKYGLNLTDNGSIEKHALIQLLAEKPEVLKAAGLDADFIKSKRRVVFYGGDSSYGHAGEAGAKEAVEKLGDGLTWGGTVLVPGGTTDYLPYINKVKALKPEVVIFDQVTNDQTIPSLIAMKQVGGLDWEKGDILLMSNDIIASDAFIADAAKEGIHVNGSINFSAIPAKPTDKAAAFYKRASGRPGASALVTYVGATYDAVMHVFKGIEASGTITDTDKMLEGIISTTYEGLNFTWKINDKKQLEQPEFIILDKDDKTVDTGIIYKDELYYGAAYEIIP